MTGQPRARLEFAALLDNPPNRRMTSGRLPRSARVMTVLAGVWLILAPRMWGYGDTGGGFDARWNDVAAGLVVLAAGIAQLVRPTGFAVAVIPIVVGFWLAIAPFALAYNLGSDPGRAMLNDTVAGTVLSGFTVSSYLSVRDAARRKGQAEPSEFPLR